MVIKLSDYILEQSISDASVDDIELERLFAEMNVKIALLDAMLKNTELVQEGSILDELKKNLGKVGEKWAAKTNLTGSSTQMLFLTIDVIIALVVTCRNVVITLDDMFNPEEYREYQAYVKEYKDALEQITDNDARKQLKSEFKIEKRRHLMSSASTTIDFVKKAFNFINPLRRTTPEAQQAIDRYYGRIQTSANELSSDYAAPVFSGTSTFTGEGDLDQILSGMLNIRKQIDSNDFKNVKEFFEKTDINTLKSELNNALKGFDEKYLKNINIALKRANIKAQNIVRDFNVSIKENKVEMMYNKQKLKQMNTKQIPTNYAVSNKK